MEKHILDNVVVSAPTTSTTEQNAGLDTEDPAPEKERKESAETNSTDKKSEKKKKRKSMGGESDEADPFAYARKFEPDIILLPPGEGGKRFPYKCLVCRTKTYPDGKIGELGLAISYSVRHFIDQHLESSHRKRMLAARGASPQSAEDSCEGLAVSNPQSGHLYTLRREFDLWAQYAHLETHAKHKYWREANNDETGDCWFIRSSSCLQTRPLSEKRLRQVCNNCLALTNSHSVPRNVARFAMKYYAAPVLQGLFLPKEELYAAEAEFNRSGLHSKDPKKVRSILALDTPKLQQFVRASICSDGAKSEALQNFISIACESTLPQYQNALWTS